MVTHERGAQPGEPLDLGGLVVAVQVEVHLVPGGDRCARPLQREVDPVAAQHPEVIVLRCGGRDQRERLRPEAGHEPYVGAVDHRAAEPDAHTPAPSSRAEAVPSSRSG
jgi:hypothetical protein